jgi:hypothetical protein
MSATAIGAKKWRPRWRRRRWWWWRRRRGKDVGREVLPSEWLKLSVKVVADTFT